MSNMEKFSSGCFPSQRCEDDIEEVGGSWLSFTSTSSSPSCSSLLIAIICIVEVVLRSMYMHLVVLTICRRRWSSVIYILYNKTCIFLVLDIGSIIHKLKIIVLVLIILVGLLHLFTKKLDPLRSLKRNNGKSNAAVQVRDRICFDATNWVFFWCVDHLLRTLDWSGEGICF